MSFKKQAVEEKLPVKKNWAQDDALYLKEQSDQVVLGNLSFEKQAVEKKLAAVKKLPAKKNWAQEDTLYLEEQDNLSNQAIVDDQVVDNQALQTMLDDLDEQALPDDPAERAFLAKRKLAERAYYAKQAELAKRELAQQVLILEQEALEKANQLWWEQMWEQTLFSLKIATPFIVIAIVYPKYFDVFGHFPTNMFTNGNIPTNNIPTNNIPTNNILANNIPANNIPENQQEWGPIRNFKPNTSGIMCFALASLTACVAYIYS